MSVETSSVVWASVTIAAAVGVALSVCRRNPVAGIVCGITAVFSWCVVGAMGNEVSRQSARDLRRQKSLEERRTKMLADFPLVSLEGRLPAVAATPVGEVLLSKESASDLLATEAATTARQTRRTELLRLLHEGTTEIFSAEIGQGSERMPAIVEHVLAAAARVDGKPMQPEIVGSPDTPQAPAAALETIEASLKSLHRLGVEEFANAQDFGFVTKDGKQAAGFLAHRITQPMKMDPRRRLKRFDLVGLLVNKQPVVYVSDKLPRMDELRTAPKRHLDGFEAAAVESLKTGEAVVLRDDHHGTRMVGAIRAGKQCLTCHETRRGELLGAFTYRFERL